ncbi:MULTISPECIES: hypothetical protein [Actinopolyspora]|nr:MULTISPECIES: hypothetical protein [Actinopolyspora]
MTGHDSMGSMLLNLSGARAQLRIERATPRAPEGAGRGGGVVA